MGEPGGLQSTGSLSRTRLRDFTFTFHFHALQKEMVNPLRCSCLEKPRDGGAWWAAVCGVAQSRTRLKRLSSSSGKMPSKRQEWDFPGMGTKIPRALCVCLVAQSCLTLATQ